MPFRLGTDADAFGDAVDVVEKGHDLDRVVDRLVREPMPAKSLDVGGADGRRLASEADGEVAERARARVEIGPAVVVGRVLR